MKIWEEETNAKGGLLGRPVKLVYYDDQIQSVDGARHLHQAARRRQGRPRGRRLCDQHDRAGDADRHAAEEDVHQPVRARVNAEFNYPKYFSVLPTGPNTKPSFTEGFFAGRGGAESEAADGRDRCGRRRNSRKNACDGARENAKTFGVQDRLRQELSAIAPPTSRRSCARSRRPMPTSWWCAPIRSIRSAWCWRSTRAGFKPKMFGGAHGRPAGHRVQEQARAEAQRHRQLRDLGADPKDDVAGRRRSSRSTRRGPRPKASIRSAITSAAGAMPTSTCWARRSRRPRASTTTRSPTSSAATPSRP